MVDLFYKGGPIFMGLLSLIMLIVISTSIIALVSIFKDKVNDYKGKSHRINRIRSWGLLAFVIGLFGQLIGLYSAFRALKMGEVEASTSLFAEGFKISMVTTIYGSLIFGFSLIIWFLFRKFA
ncbi:MotA/TolQ/ExbB proton channel family protein [Winogradskyella aurantia]|uniref:MotA/TolQ/ExbB proton channel domain-containing protein n=1 Tax=Winogradskyella aurantia TaxID=1915063 RepID=A0A265UTH4_9FLAO|nr:MotA/TolQ/ExbB proton channel family protein [Winogradskyella aurantia]OZV68613.1 hypothetical protein CA834_09085 [Winogradskyella aurantia]